MCVHSPDLTVGFHAIEPKAPLRIIFFKQSNDRLRKATDTPQGAGIGRQPGQDPRASPLSLVAGARRLPLLSVQTSIAARDLFAEAVADANLCSRILYMFENSLNRMYGSLASFVC